MEYEVPHYRASNHKCDLRTTSAPQREARGGAECIMKSYYCTPQSKIEWSASARASRYFLRGSARAAPAPRPRRARAAPRSQPNVCAQRAREYAKRSSVL